MFNTKRGKKLFALNENHLNLFFLSFITIKIFAEKNYISLLMHNFCNTYTIFSTKKTSFDENNSSFVGNIFQSLRSGFGFEWLFTYKYRYIVR